MLPAILSLLAVFAPGAGASSPLPPEPEFPTPGDSTEARADALPPGDPARPALLLEVALRRHAEAARAEVEERGRRATPGATPRADALRAEAIRLAERALDEGADGADGGERTFPRAPEALLVAGLDAARVGRARDALRFLGALVRRHPDHALAAYAWLALGERHAADGDLTRARAALEVAACTGRPALRGWAAVRLAEVALSASDGEVAAEALFQGVAAGSPRAVVLVEDLSATPARLPWGPSALARLADAAERAGELEAAARLREHLLARPPRSPDPELRAARATLDALRRELAPGDPPPRLRAGLALRRVGEAPGAADLATARARLGAAPADEEALETAGLAALDAGRPGEARVLLARAAGASAEGADRAGAEVNLAGALYLLGRVAEARATADGAAARVPGFAAGHEVAGAIALAAGDAAGAEGALAAAVALEPARWQARLLHAEALATMGRGGDALAEAERVLDLERGQAEALQLAAALRERARAAASQLTAR